MPSPLSLPYASRITGTGSAFPATRVSNEDLHRIVDTSDEWIRERTGITERRRSRPGHEPDRNSSLAAAAAIRALEMAGKAPEDLDAILFATCTPDTLIPSTACWLQAKIGAKNAWAIDLNAACAGFVFALSTADQFIRTGQAQTVLVVGSEVLSAFTNWEDRNSCILFGDGAGAVVVERTKADSEHRILSSHLKTDGTLADFFQIVAGGSNLQTTPEAHTRKLDKMQMHGTEIFKESVRTLVNYAVQAVKSNGLELSDVKWFVPHQANLRIIRAVAKRLELPLERVLINIDRYGNTSAATVPTAFDEAVRDGRIKSGDVILFDVFGAGLTYGSLLLRW